MDEVNKSVQTLMLVGILAGGYYFYEYIWLPAQNTAKVVKEAAEQVAKGYAEAGEFGTPTYWKDHVTVNEDKKLEVKVPTGELIGAALHAAENPIILGQVVHNSFAALEAPGPISNVDDGATITLISTQNQTKEVNQMAEAFEMLRNFFGEGSKARFGPNRI